MDTFYELTEAECEAVAGGGAGQSVAFVNHFSGGGPGKTFAELQKDLEAMSPPFPDLHGGGFVGSIVSGRVAAVHANGPGSMPAWLAHSPF
jgi:hypothetical protein